MTRKRRGGLSWTARSYDARDGISGAARNYGVLGGHGAARDFGGHAECGTSTVIGTGGESYLSGLEPMELGSPL